MDDEQKRIKILSKHSGSTRHEAVKALPPEQIVLNNLSLTHSAGKIITDVDFLRYLKHKSPVKRLSLKDCASLAFNVGAVLAGCVPPDSDFLTELGTLIMHFPHEGINKYKQAFGFLLGKSEHGDYHPEFVLPPNTNDRLGAENLDTWLLENPIQVSDSLKALSSLSGRGESATIARSPADITIAGIKAEWTKVLHNLKSGVSINENKLGAEGKKLRDSVLSVTMVGMIMIRAINKEPYQIQQSLIMKYRLTIKNFVANVQVNSGQLVVGGAVLIRICSTLSTQVHLLKSILSNLLIYHAIVSNSVSPYNTEEHIRITGMVQASVLNCLAYSAMPLLRVIETAARTLGKGLLDFMKAISISFFADALRAVVDAVNASSDSYPLFLILEATNLNYMTDPKAVYEPIVRLNKNDDQDVKGMIWQWSKIFDPTSFDMLRAPGQLQLYTLCCLLIAANDADSRILHSIHFANANEVDKERLYKVALLVMEHLSINFNKVTVSGLGETSDIAQAIAEDLRKTGSSSKTTPLSYAEFMRSKGFNATIPMDKVGEPRGKFGRSTAADKEASSKINQRAKPPMRRREEKSPEIDDENETVENPIEVDDESENESEHSKESDIKSQFSDEEEDEDEDSPDDDFMANIISKKSTKGG